MEIKLEITSNTNYLSSVNIQSSLLNIPKVPNQLPRKSALSEPDKFEVFTNRDKVKDFTSFISEHTPFCYDLKDLVTEFNITTYALRQKLVLLLYTNLAITIDTSLHTTLSNDEHVIPLCEWLRHGKNCILTKFSMLGNFLSYIKQKLEEWGVTLKELNTIQYHKPSKPSILIRFALMLRYSPYQTYKLVLKELSLPSLSVLNKLRKGVCSKEL